MRRGVLIFFVLFLASMGIMFGSQKRRQEKVSKPLEHEVTVTLAVVEVFVTDKDGNFVDYLTKDDFEIFEDGKRVEIKYFAIVKPKEEITEEIIPGVLEKKEIPPPAQKMKLVILFDNLNTHRFYLISQWPQIVEMFLSLSGKVDETMILELNRFSGMKIIQPFTSDKTVLTDKISEFKADSWKEVEEHYLRSQLEALAIEASIPMEDRILGNPEYLMYALRQEDRYLKRMRLSDSFSSFLAAVNYIRRFKGVKSVLIVSDGFHLQERGIDMVRIFDPFKVFGGKRVYEQHQAFQKFLELINEERLIFYAISPRGLRQYFSAYGFETWPGGIFAAERSQWLSDDFTLEEITHKTGGLHLTGEKKYEDFISELGRDLTHFYDISYTPPRESRKKGFHRIEVRVKRPGLVVRHRKGYSDFTDEEIENRTVASAFISPSFFRDLDFSCKTDFLFIKGGHPQFWIRMQLPLDQFRKNEELHPPEKLGVMFGINRWEEKRVHYGETEFSIKDAMEKGINYFYRVFATSIVKLKPGEYDTRVLLKQAGDKIGGWEDTLKIPDLKKMNSPALLNSILGFLKKEDKDNPTPFSVASEDSSLLLSQYRFYPYVENVFREGREVAVFLQVFTPQKAKDIPIQFELYQDENVSFLVSSKQVETSFDKELKILNTVYILNFDKVPPGDYKLQIKSSEIPGHREVKVKVIQ